MIDLEQPSLGLNSHHDHHVHVQMWNTGDVPASKPAVEIAEWIRLVAVSAPGGRLKNVVFSCHGSPGHIGIGTGIGTTDIPAFARLLVSGRPLVAKYWFRCCQVAQIAAANTAADGNRFCSAFAVTTGAYVVASTELQWSHGRTLPFGQLDGFEGLVLSYGPAGNITWQTRYRSGWFDSAGGGAYETPD
ncbi:MAG TPA: hypothetical protein VLJ18_10885 [Thermoanaerobaculia bacterium]|nr:hypothetical protein [Thermoanaerobaculia bacterium]